MRIAILCKQRYTGRDVIHDRYGRLYEIPRQLAKLGHALRVYCIDYYGHEGGEWEHNAGSGSLTLNSYTLGNLRIPALMSYPKHLLRSLKAFQPEIIIGASDIPNIALASFAAKKLRIPLVVDLYDNFEGFPQARIPGFIPALKYALRKAKLITTVSDPLSELIRKEYKVSAPIITIPNAIDKNVFKPSGKLLARKKLLLPNSAKLIGTAGGLYRAKGIETLYKTWHRLKDTDPNIHLVLAGPLENSLPLPAGERVHYLGHLSNPSVADLFNALDLGIITLSDSLFGSYCFPQKAYEMLACSLPIAATDVGVMPELLKNHPELLYPAGDANGLFEVICQQLERPTTVNLPLLEWQQLLERLESKLRELTKTAHKNKLSSNREMGSTKM